MPLFGQKPAANTGVPTDLVNNLRQQGFPDDQIIQQLQTQGYSPPDISNAMSQAGIGGPAQMAPDQGMPPPMDQGMPPPMDQGMPPPMDQGMPPPMGGMPSMPAPGAPPPSQEPPRGKEEMEEEIEAIIDEKWKDLTKNITKITQWKDSVESRMSKIEQEIADIKENFESLHKGILAKISEYDQNIVNVGTEIKAMEKVFQKILPTFTENVNKLSRITDRATSKK